MAGTIHEGPEFGVGDFVLLDNLDISSFMANLKLRLVAYDLELAFILA